jgi:hypothetical protein
VASLRTPQHRHYLSRHASRLHLQAICGCLVALGGGLWYARARSQIGERAKQRTAAYAAQAQEAADDADEETADSRPMVPRQ